MLQKETFVPILSDGDGLSRSNTETLYAGLSKESVTLDENPSTNLDHVNVDSRVTSTLADLMDIPSYSLTEKEGDLFFCPSGFSLVHCVSQDFHMSLGIAKEFKSHFPVLKDL